MTPNDGVAMPEGDTQATPTPAEGGEQAAA